MPDPNPAPAPAPAPAPSPAPAPAWHGQTDQAVVDYVANKGWQSPADVIKSYQGAEKLIGRNPADLIVAPRADDPAGFLGVMDRLGRPASPDKYEFAKPAGDAKLDEGYVNWARGTFHELGLTASQVKTLTGKHNEYIAGLLTQQSKDYSLRVESEKRELLQEWGAGHERKFNAASAAAKALGFSPEMIDSMERAVGYKGTYKFFSDLATKLGEDNFSAGGGQPRFDGMLTPAEAKTQWETFKADKTMMAALRDPMHPNHKAAKEKQTNLFKVMYPEG